MTDTPRAERWAAAVERAARRPPPAIMEALVEQQTALGAPTPSRRGHLAALAEGRAAAVVTGQQVGLFGGPLFTLYKAATAVRLAAELEVASGRPVVPIFWLQTEDHDIAEVDHCALYRPPEGPLWVSLGARHGQRASLSEIALGERLASCLEVTDELLAGEPHGAETLALLREAYRPERRYHEAFAELLATLFADQGLVVFNPRDARVAGAAAPLHRRALEQAGPISAALRQRARELEEAGHATPVHVREGAPLSFFHPTGADGPRYRLEAAEGAYRLVGAQGFEAFSESDLLVALEGEPAAFSTSALLRPVVQDALLPVVATVGGPSEVAYLAQLPPLYEALDVRPSRPVRRAGYRLVDPRLRRRLAALGLSGAEVEALGPEGLERHVASVAAEGVPPEELVERLLAPLEAELDALAPWAEELDPAFYQGLTKTRETVGRAVSRLAGRYRQALLRRDASAQERLRYVASALLPGGVPQQRVYGMPSFLARVGPEALVSAILDAIVDPLAGTSGELSL